MKHFLSVIESMKKMVIQLLHIHKVFPFLMTVETPTNAMTLQL